eukprot:UN10478
MSCSFDPGNHGPFEYCALGNPCSVTQAACSAAGRSPANVCWINAQFICCMCYGHGDVVILGTFNRSGQVFTQTISNGTHTYFIDVDTFADYEYCPVTFDLCHDSNNPDLSIDITTENGGDDEEVKAIDGSTKCMYEWTPSKDANGTGFYIDIEAPQLVALNDAKEYKFKIEFETVCTSIGISLRIQIWFRLC